MPFETIKMINKMIKRPEKGLFHSFELFLSVKVGKSWYIYRFVNEFPYERQDRVKKPHKEVSGGSTAILKLFLTSFIFLLVLNQS